ncbi:MAG: chemotaxis protein CheA [Pseudomonadota bacterium]
MNDLMEQFLIEGSELVQVAIDDLMALERDPADVARLDSAFRAVHTLKGSAGLFDLVPMGRVLHAMENLLEQIRAGALTASGRVIDTLLEAIAAIEGWIEAIGTDGGLPAEAPSHAATLDTALRASLHLDAPPADTSAARVPDWLVELLLTEATTLSAAAAAGDTLTALRYVPAPDCFFLGDDPMAVVRSVPEPVVLAMTQREASPASALDVFACNLIITLVSRAPAEAIRRAVRFVADQVEIAEIPRATGPGANLPTSAVQLGGRSMRVDAARVDGLLDLVGELVVAKNRLAHLVHAAGPSIDPQLAHALADSQNGIERLADAMHSTVMHIRMVPLAKTLRRFPRLVRDAAAQLGKTVHFVISGEAEQADKSIVDGLFEPLLHLLRNAVGHGIEDGTHRLAAGKQEAGRITLSARRLGEGLVVEVRDDGAGIDPAILRRVAKERHLLPDASIDALDDTSAMELVFLPGFSTAAAVTSLSGRGVGMDAVRAAVEALGGKVMLDSRPGAGSTIRISVPQGAVATDLLTVQVAGELFGIPVEMVSEAAHVPADRILPLRDGEAFVLRNRTLPLLRLSVMLGLPAPPRPERTRVLIATSPSGRVGLEVDAFAERMAVLLRPLDGLVAGMPGILGTALLGDGRVLMVLDLPELLP